MQEKHKLCFASLDIINNYSLLCKDFSYTAAREGARQNTINACSFI